MSDCGIVSSRNAFYFFCIRIVSYCLIKVVVHNAVLYNDDFAETVAAKAYSNNARYFS